jgi:hypothetical protein
MVRPCPVPGRPTKLSFPEAFLLELFRRMWLGWQRFVKGVLLVQNTVLMGFVWVFGLGPVAIGAKLVRHPFLDREPADPAAKSHWKPRDPKPMDMKAASRPF